MPNHPFHFSYRFGICISTPQISNLLNATKAPYNLPTPTSVLALTALSPASLATMQATVQTLNHQRSLLRIALRGLPRIGKFLDGDNANFVLVQILDEQGKVSNNEAMRVYRELAENRGVVVRFRGGEVGCEGCLRITIGTKDECDMLIKELNEIWTFD